MGFKKFLLDKIYRFLNWLSKFTKTDMVYLVEGSFWWIFGKIFSFLASLLILIFFGKFASKEVYGTYQYVISMAVLFGIFSLPGLNSPLVVAIAQGKDKTFFLCEKIKLKWGLFSAFASFFVALWYFLKGNLNLAISFLIVGFFLPPFSVFSLYPLFWQGKKKFALQNQYFILHNFLAALLFVFVIYFKPKIIPIIFGYYFSFTLSTFLFWFLTRKKIEKETPEEKKVISFGKHASLMVIPDLVAGQIDKIILWRIEGPSAVATYTYSLRVIERILELIPFQPLALPKMAQKNLDQNGVKKAIFDKFLKLFLFVFPLTIFYILICPIFFEFFFPSYRNSIIYSQVLAFSLFFSPFLFLSTTFLVQMKKRELYLLSFVPPLLKILLFLVLIPIFGIWGGVISILLSQGFYSLLSLYLFLKF